MYLMNSRTISPQEHSISLKAEHPLSIQSFLSCLNTPLKDVEQLHFPHNMVNSFKRQGQTQQNKGYELYPVVLDKRSQLISLFVLTSKWGGKLDLISFSISDQISCICLWIRIANNKEIDSNLNQILKTQIQHYRKYFFFPQIKSMEKFRTLVDLNLFLLILFRGLPSKSSKEALRQVNSLDLERVIPKNQDISCTFVDGSVMQSKSYTTNIQSYQYIIQSEMTPDSEYFRNINQALKTGNYLSLKQCWDSQLQYKLEHIEKHWDIYKEALSDQIFTFTRLNKYKEFRINNALSQYKGNNILPNLYDHIYPKINHFIRFFCKKLDIQKREVDLIKKYNEIHKQKCRRDDQYYSRNVDYKNHSREGQQQREAIQQQMRHTLQIKDSNAADQFFQQLLRDDTKTSHNDSKDRIKINESKKLREYICSSQHFYQNSSHWSHLLTTFYHCLNQSTNSHYFAKIESERLVQNRCLGCSRFFIHNQNIYDQQVCLSPIKVFSSIRKLKQLEPDLKDQICGLLNSGGGIILFNCQQKYKGIYPEGASMTQKDKQQFEQRIYSYSSQFYPRLQIKTHIHVTFVPILSIQEGQNASQLQNKRYYGEEAILKPYNQYKHRHYSKGVFVTRIKVIPADPSLVYFWHVPNKSSHQGIRNYCQINHPNGGKSKLTNKQIVRKIKKRIKQFYVKQSLQAEDRRLLMHPKNYLNHDCPEPDIGIALAEMPKSHMIQKPQQGLSLEDKYSYLTLVLARDQFHQNIRQIFRRSRFNFQLEPLFKEQGFRTTKNTAAMFHNIKFQEIFFKINNNPNFVFSGRSTLIINVTSFLKLDDRNQSNPLAQERFIEIANSFAMKFPNETLKAFRFKNINSRSKFQQEYFLQTQSKISNLYLYYLINDKFERVVFKNPYLLDKLSQIDREIYMVQVYERKGRNDIISNLNVKRAQSSIVDMRLPISSDLNQEEDSDIPLNKRGSKQAQQQTEKLEITTNKPKNRQQWEKVEQQQDYLYENWEEVIQQYGYIIIPNHKSLNTQDL